MQYGHLPTLQDRRDDNNTTPFQTHQSLGQALGQHLSYRTPDYRHPSTSPPTHPQPPPSHSPLAAFTVAPANSPSIKRKHVDSSVQQVIKRGRRELDDADPYDLDPGGQGAKHWTDEEKSKLFTWLMGIGQDEHWNALRATKNSCLRECAMDVFGSKKTYQALKGCYERNFNLFKQIYAFEQFHAPNNNLGHLSEADRLREYERRLATARKQGCDVGNITARTIEHWHRRGWYELFYRRWHGDPATTRPSQSRNNNNTNSSQGGPPDDTEPDEQHHHHHHTPSAPQQQQQQPQLPPQQVQAQAQQPPPQPQPHHQQQHQQSTNTPNTTTNASTTNPNNAAPTGLDFSTDPTASALTNGINGFTPHLNYINPQSLRDNPLVPPSPATVPTGPTPSSSIHTGAAAMTGGGGTGGLGGPSTMANGNPGPSSSQHPHLFAGVGSAGGPGSHGGLGGGGGGSAHQGLGATTSSSSSNSGGIGAGPHSGSTNPSTIPSSSSSSTTATTSTGGTSSGSSSSSDPPVVNITITQNMLSTYLQFLQVQTQTGKMKLEYLRRREEREEKESVQRREMERMKLEREAAEFEHSKHSANTKQKADRAIELLSNPSIDASVKHAASEFLKKLFATD